jgi:hypothetical protein
MPILKYIVIIYILSHHIPIRSHEIVIFLHIYFHCVLLYWPLVFTPQVPNPRIVTMAVTFFDQVSADFAAASMAVLREIFPAAPLCNVPLGETGDEKR